MNRRVLVVLVIAILISGAVPNVYSTPRTIVVASTSDSGLGTLRQALLGAQSGDTITFDTAVFPPQAPATIHLMSSLPHLTQGKLTIDGSNAGVVLDGGMITDESVSGLEITSDGNIIRGLQIVSFPVAAVSLHDGAQNNIVGGDRSVGTGPLGQGNLLSGKGSFGVGIWKADTSFNTIIGNYIGTDLSGTAARDIRRDGIHMNGASHNQVINNLISGNMQSGVYICCGGEGNIIRDNHIGTDIGGLNPLGNHQSGVAIDQGAHDNVIGPGNIIAHNNQDGISISGSNSLRNTITRNSIHDNKAPGIALFSGGNTGLATPLILDFDLAVGTAAGISCANCAMEIFSDKSDEGGTYEASTTSDNRGLFAFTKGRSFTGPHLTATATDADGNTSPFSAPTLGTRRSTNLQEGNNLPKTQLQPKQSRDLEDNHIGTDQPFNRGANPTPDDYLYQTNNLGQKWMLMTIDWAEWDPVEANGQYSRYYIDPSWQQVITGLAHRGIKMLYSLVFWDEKIQPQQCYSRFKDEGEIQRYLDYVQFIVHNFKDRIQYYEMINEPRLNQCAPFNQQNIRPADYVELVRRTVAVIRQEYPEAKIVVGATVLFYERYYLFDILGSDIMPLVDGVSWHPFFGTSPEFQKDYYYNYSSTVQEIKDVASAHGFKGEYLAESLTWSTLLNPPGDPSKPTYNETVAAKYYARGITMNLGMDLTITLGAWSPDYELPKMRVIRNLCTLMAGAKPVSLPVEIRSEATNIRSYSFSLPNGDKLLALWTDGAAVEDDPGVKAKLIFQGSASQFVTGIDVLAGFQQPIIASNENRDLVVSNLLVRDYPLILRLSSTTTSTSTSSSTSTLKSSTSTSLTTSFATSSSSSSSSSSTTSSTTTAPGVVSSSSSGTTAAATGPSPDYLLYASVGAAVSVLAIGSFFLRRRMSRSGRTS